ncbi:MAG: phosphodiester glycosidase family protein [Synergistaceae bacterium]|nr:phosphodiester glycosidase family protein [Synergistaceae bacterium]
MNGEVIEIDKVFLSRRRVARDKIALNFLRIVSFFALFLLFPGTSHAVTKGEFAARLFGELGYQAARDPSLPPDVPKGHNYAKQIGSAVRYGLLPGENFMPDTEIDRHGAVRMSLAMMGWEFEASLYESLNSLPDMAGSGDSIFFLAAEMNPPAPSALLLDGMVPLSDSGAASLLNWVRNCRKSVSWNRVIPFGGAEFIVYRQGVARPGEPNAPGEGNPVGAPGNEPLYVAAIGVHMTGVDMRIAFAASLGLEKAKLSEFAEAYEPISAINGGFFAEARPLGSMLFEGNPAGKPIEGRSALGWNNDDGTFAFGPGFAMIGVRTPGGFVMFDRFNVAPQMNEASFYPAGVMGAAAGTALDAIELAIKNGRVLEKREGAWGNHFLPDGGSLIVARGNSRALLEKFKAGDKINVTSDWEANVFRSCGNLIQAGPMLIYGGQMTADSETFKSDITDKRHPRTIVGSDGDRLIWAVIDGRSSLHSRGTTMEETRWVARALGLSTAINMDGGGSSELIWRGIVANMPSDGKERPLPYAVLMMPKGAAMARKTFMQAPDSYADFAPAVNGPGEEVPYMDTYNPYE